MNNLEVITEEIKKLESQALTYSVADKLASLYIILEHNSPATITKKELSPVLNGSEFLDAVSSVDVSSLLRILDEHMNVVQLLFPMEYEALIKKNHCIKKVGINSLLFCIRDHQACIQLSSLRKSQ